MTNMTCLIKLTGITEMEIDSNKKAVIIAWVIIKQLSYNPKKPIGLKLLVIMQVYMCFQW